MPSKSLFPHSCVSSGGSMVGLMTTSCKRAYVIPTSAAPRAPVPAAGHCWPISLQETLKQFWLSVCRVSGSWCSKGSFEPSECLWWVRGLILNAISPLLPSCWGFSFAPGRGVFCFFFWWDPVFSSQWLFSRELQFWSSHSRRRWV